MTTTNARTISRPTRWLTLLAGLTLTTATLSTAPAGAAPPDKEPRPGTITTVAGGLGDHKQATSVSLPGPNHLALDPDAESLYITQWQGGHRVRKLDLETGIITTVAGTGFLGQEGWYPLGDGGPATEAGLNASFGVAVDQRGTLYVADQANHRIRAVAPPRGKKGKGGGTISTVAGGNGPLETAAGGQQFHDGDFCGDGGKATDACLNLPTGVAIDDQGNLFIGEFANHRIRRVDAGTGVITTVVGNGTASFCGDGGPATEACLAFPLDVSLDPAGNLFIAEQSNHRIRRVDASTGVITTVAGNGISGYCGDGGPATQACLNRPHAIAFDPAGNLLIADTSNQRIRRVDASTGVITTIAGNGTPATARGSEGEGLAVGDGGPATLAQLGVPGGLAVDRAGNVFIADRGVVQRIRRVDAETGIITTIAGNGHAAFSGDGGPALLAELAAATGVAVGPAANLYIADQSNHRIRRLDRRHGTIDTVAGSSSSAGYGGDGGRATRARLAHPGGVAVDPADNLYIADAGNCLVRRVDANTGTITTVAGVPPGTRPPIGSGSNCEGSPDEVPAQTAPLGSPTDVAFGPDGALYIALWGSCLVRKVDHDGIITTVAGTNAFDTVQGTACGYSGDGGPATEAKLSGVLGVTVDHAGNIYIADSGKRSSDIPSNNRIRRVDAQTGIITTIAGTGRLDCCGIGFYSGDGGPASQADVNLPTKLAVDTAGNLFIADTKNQRMRRVDAETGIITTITGNGTWNHCGDGGPATQTCLANPTGLAFDPTTGDLYIGESDPGKAPVYVRKVTGIGATA